MKEKLGLIVSMFGFFLIMGAVGELDLGGGWWPALGVIVIGLSLVASGAVLLKE